MPGRLLYRDAQGKDAHVDIPNEGVYLGRGADCAVRTDDAMVSRKNCKISFAGGRWTVEDLGSSNGTFINEQRIQKQALTHADVIRCGTLQVRFVEVAGGAPAGKPRTMSMEAQAAAHAASAGSSVHVDPALQQGLNPANLMHMKDREIGSVVAERDSLAQELQTAHAIREANDAELGRLRTESVQMRDKLSELTRQKSLQDEELHAQGKVSEELRIELAAIRDEHLQFRTRNDELSEEVAARDRQLERALEDVQRGKASNEELRSALTEMQRTKDEGWRELNSRVGELDNLREVISEQERLLEERRVGLITLEANTKEMRTDRERLMRDTVQIKTERDELRDRAIKLAATVEALEEEHRRLARAIADGGGGGGGGSGNDDHMRLATELRELKIEHKGLESEKQRLSSDLSRAEGERKELEDRLHKTEVERDKMLGEKAASDQARKRLEEGFAKAETARQRADEERAAAVAARDSALVNTDGLRKELERAKTQVGDLEAHSATLSGSTASMAAVKPEEMGATSEHDISAAARIHELEEELSKLSSELAVVKEAKAAKPAPAPAPAPAAGGNGEVKKRAEEAYNGINDVLSELRTSILLARDLITAGDTSAALGEAIQASVDRTEDAKGILRTLKEVIET